jgi:hypothetical protein
MMVGGFGGLNGLLGARWAGGLELFGPVARTPWAFSFFRFFHFGSHKCTGLDWLYTRFCEETIVHCVVLMKRHGAIRGLGRVLICHH